MSDIKLGSEVRRGPRGPRGPAGPNHVHVDPSTLEGDGSEDHPLRVIGVKGPTSGPGAIVAGPGLAPGMPFYIDDDGIGQPAQSDTLQHATVIGIVTDLIPSDTVVDVAIVEYAIVAILVEITVSVWAARTGDPSGLVTGQTYYVGSTPGSLTTMQPLVGFSTKVGVAQAPNVLSVAIGTPVEEGV